MATLVDPSAGVDATVMQPGPEELRAELLREAARAQGRGKDFR